MKKEKIITYSYYVSDDGGKTHKLIGQYDSGMLESRPLGHHLLSVTEGCKTTSFKVDPDFVSLLAASVEMQEEMVKAMCDTTKEPYSLYDVARAGTNFLLEKAKEQMNNPTTQKALDKLLSLVKISQ